MEVFKSSAWTLTYRELRAVEEAQPDQVRPRWMPQASAQRLPDSQGSPYAWTSLKSIGYTMPSLDGLAVQRGPRVDDARFVWLSAAGSTR